jgi:hypothetical protein
MQFGDAVDVLAANGRQVRHTDELVSGLIDDRHARDFPVVSRECIAYCFQEAAVDLVDDLDVTGKQPGKQRQRPALKRFR